MSRHAIEARIAQHSPGGRITVTVNYHVDGTIVKTRTWSNRNRPGKQLDTALQEMLGRGVKEDLERWIDQPGLW